jgi:uncharacterized membrane protein
MDDFDLYRLFKTLHVLAVIGLGGSIIVESMIGPMLARATSMAQVKTLARLMRSSEMIVGIPSTLLVPVFGYATASFADIPLDQTWLLIAQILYWIAAVVGLGYLSRAALELDKQVRDLPDGPVPAAIQAAMSDPKPAALGGVLTLFFLIIVYLMVARPGW